MTFEAVYHQPQPNQLPIAVVGHASQVTLLADELHDVSASGFEVRRLPSAAAATAAVRDRQVAAAYVDAGPAAAVYLARAAAPIRASYLQGVFARIASQAGHQPPPVVDLVPLAAGDGGTGIFFVVFPLMMTGVITAIVLLQVSAWPIGRRVVAVAGVGAVGAMATYLTAVSLNILVARLNANGSLDTTFGNSGVLTTGFQGSDQAVAVLIQPNGDIIAIGNSVDGVGVTDLALARYLG